MNAAGSVAGTADAGAATPVVAATPSASADAASPTAAASAAASAAAADVIAPYSYGQGPTANGDVQFGTVQIPSTASPASGSAFGAGFKSRCLLAGNFDVQVTYVLAQWPSGSGVRVGLGGEALNGVKVGTIVRVGFGASLDFPDQPREAYAADFPDGTAVAGAASDTTGALRLTRTGATITGYFAQNGQWVQAHSSSTFGTPPVRIAYSAWSDQPVFGQRTATVRFEHFQVNSGAFSCS